MRIVFMGSPETVVAPLQSVIQLEEDGQHELVAVVSQPAKPVGRKGVLTDPPLAAFAKKQGIKVWQPEKASDPAFLEQLRDAKPDVIITAAYGQILSDIFLTIPSRATINIHPSLLPKYRGAIPVPAALLDGLEKTGVTILFTVKQLDAGNIIVQEAVDIFSQEKADALTQRLFMLGGELLGEALDKLADPDFQGKPQDDKQATHCRKILKNDGVVQWEAPSAEIYNRFRAFYPWPGTFTFFNGERVVIEDMEPAQTPSASPLRPGSFVFDKTQKVIRVGSADGELWIRALKPAGSRLLDAPAFWNGLKNRQEPMQFTPMVPEEK